MKREKTARDRFQRSRARVEPSILNYCKDQWGSERWTMIQYCVDRETQAKERVEEERWQIGMNIYRDCRAKWGTPRWSLIRF
ncbi:MAG: hypothetical protein GWO19_27625, partial [Nitrospinaceae bacterium]|nr:hypothetical protein [Nitrospinaceae bacterium]NIS88272.1 hypothetical protein [Nitrospinaceae bacterium]